MLDLIQNETKNVLVSQLCYNTIYFMFLITFLRSNSCIKVTAKSLNKSEISST